MKKLLFLILSSMMFLSSCTKEEIYTSKRHKNGKYINIIEEEKKDTKEKSPIVIVDKKDIKENKDNNKEKEDIENIDAKKVYYTKDTVNLRKEDNTDSTIITQINANTKLIELSSAKNGFIKVEYNNEIGYVFKDLLSQTPLDNSNDEDTSNENNTNDNDINDSNENNIDHNSNGNDTNNLESNTNHNN